MVVYADKLHDTIDLGQAPSSNPPYPNRGKLRVAYDDVFGDRLVLDVTHACRQGVFHASELRVYFSAGVQVFAAGRVALNVMNWHIWSSPVWDAASKTSDVFAYTWEPRVTIHMRQPCSVELLGCPLRGVAGVFGMCLVGQVVDDS